MIKLISSKDKIELQKKISFLIGDGVFEKCFVYKLNDNLIGFIDFSDIYDRLELNYIWIDPKYRGNNYSKILMNFMIDYVINKKEIKNITLEVSVDNYVAINLYTNYGFNKVAIRSQYYNGVDGLLMIRKFDKDE